MSTRVIGFGMLLQALALSSPAAAEDLPELKQRRARVMTASLGEKPLALLKREPGPGREKARMALLLQLGTVPSKQKAPLFDSGDASSSVGTDLTTVRSLAGRRWSLQIRGDGTNASFHDDDVATSKRALGVPKRERMTTERLVALGQSFRISMLGNQIRLGAGERLVPIATRYQVEDAAERANASGMAREVTSERVIASRVLFGREVDGHPVLGPGSRLSVTFANDGTVIGFEYDWPQYRRTGAKRATLSLDGVLVRVAERSRLPLDAPSVAIENMDCGFYDSAVPGASVQPACMVNYHSRAEGGAMSFSDAIPVGAVFEENSEWPESAPTGKRRAPVGAQRTDFLTAVRGRLAKASENMLR